jgi:hypothetical protein
MMIGLMWQRSADIPVTPPMRGPDLLLCDLRYKDKTRLALLILETGVQSTKLPCVAGSKVLTVLKRRSMVQVRRRMIHEALR